MRKLRSELEFAPSQADYPVYVFPKQPQKMLLNVLRMNDVVMKRLFKMDMLGEC